MSLSFKKRKNLLIIALSVVLVVAFLLLVLAIISPFIMIANEGTFLKADLNNPYINSNYNDWTWTKINHRYECLFPMQWDIAESEDVVQIIDENENVIAVGTVLNAEESVFTSQEAFLSHIFGSNVEEISVSHTPEFVQINGSFLGTIITSGDIEKTCGVFILQEQKDSISTELFFVFPDFEYMDSVAMVEITQAISFSYSFPENCR